MKLTKLEQKLNSYENKLSRQSAKNFIFPVLYGVQKISLGIIQTTAAVAIFALSPLTILYKLNLSIVRHSFCHILHGIGNIVAGCIESVPVVSAIFYDFIRNDRGPCKFAKEKSPSFKLSTEIHSLKFFPYETLLRKDLALYVKTPDGRAANVFYKKFYSNEPIGALLSEIKRKHPNASSCKIKRLFFKKANELHGKNATQYYCRKGYSSENSMNDKLVKVDYEKRVYSNPDGSDEKPIYDLV